MTLFYNFYCFFSVAVFFGCHRGTENTEERNLNENPIFLHDSYFGWQGALNPFFMPWGMNKGFKVP